MQVERTPLEGVMIITPRRIADTRGMFSESWSRRRLKAAGIDIDFVQDNHSISGARGTLRGLHFQTPPHAQDKLVRCGRGALFDVAVDIRHGSATYGRWFGVELSAENGKQLLVPKGFLHGFVTLLPDTEVVYKCSDYYEPSCDRAIRWNDPELAIDWPLEGAPILSEKDRNAPFLSEIEPVFHV